MSTTSVILRGECPWCGAYHTGVCPRVKAITYDSYGQIARVEFHDSDPPGSLSAAALRAAKQVADAGESRADWNRLDKALAPLFGEDTTP